MSEDFTSFETNLLGAIADLEEEVSRISPLDMDPLTAYNLGKSIGSAQRVMMMAGWDKIDGVWEWDEDNDYDVDLDLTGMFEGEEAVEDTASTPTKPTKSTNPNCFFGQKDCDCKINESAFEEYLATNPLD